MLGSGNSRLTSDDPGVAICMGGKLGDSKLTASVTMALVIGVVVGVALVPVVLDGVSDPIHAAGVRGRAGDGGCDEA